MKKQLIGGYSAKETEQLLQALRDENAAMHIELDNIRAETAKQLAEMREKLSLLEAENLSLKGGNPETDEEDCE